jgi:hypothetical protein
VLLGDAPVPVLVAVFDPGVALQVHGAWTVRQFPAAAKGVGLDPAACLRTSFYDGAGSRGRVR